MSKMKLIWKRKVRRIGNELVIGLPNELKHYFKDVEYVLLVLENDKLLITTCGDEYGEGL